MFFVDLTVLLPGNPFNAASNPRAGFLDHLQTLISLGDIPLRHFDNRQRIPDVVVEISHLFEAPLKASITSTEYHPNQENT
jgi:hypothetical protein